MIYTVKKGDTLGQIAKAKGTTVDILLDLNPKIVDADKIRVGDRISLPTLAATSDIPTSSGTSNVCAPTVEEILTRARSAMGKNIIYKLGEGGMNPKSLSPAGRKNQCDCSGFIAWVFGISRKTNHPLYLKHNGGWLNTTGMVHDLENVTGFFSKTQHPRVGCIIVYPWIGSSIGHVGLVSSVDGKNVSRVIHCSSGNYRKTGDAIQETDPEVFIGKPKLAYGRWK